jgi:hypothetical protein
MKGGSMLSDDKSYLASRYSFFLMGAQGVTGIAFDQEAARALVKHILAEMQRIEADVEPRLPPRRLKKSEEGAFTVPAKPFKKDGSVSATMERFLERHGCKMEPNGQSFRWIDGSWHTVEAGALLPASMPMRLGNQEDLKAWFLEDLKWNPLYWNYKKDERGKPVKDKKTGQPIRTSPKMQEAGRLCPNLEALEGELVKRVVRWLSLRNRLSVVQGWLENPRLACDGRLSAGSAGITNTHRQKHTVVVNVPKAEDGVVLGREMRSLYVARPGRVRVGYDAAAIENRVEAHFVYPYPGGPEYAEEILSGDPHKKNAFVFYAKQLEEKELVFDTADKDHPEFKPFRSKSKNAKYCLSYGGSGPKLAKTLGLDEKFGEQLYEAFWKANEPLAKLREAVTTWWELKGQKKFIKGIDGRLLMTRSKHSLVNTLFQSTGAVVMDYSAMFMDKWLGGIRLDDEKYPCYHYKGHVIYRDLYQHDELGFDCPEEIAEEIGKMGCKSIEQAGKYLKMRVPLGGECKIGADWSKVH